MCLYRSEECASQKDTTSERKQDAHREERQQEREDIHSFTNEIYIKQLLIDKEDEKIDDDDIDVCAAGVYCDSGTWVYDCRCTWTLRGRCDVYQVHGAAADVALIKDVLSVNVIAVTVEPSPVAD